MTTYMTTKAGRPAPNQLVHTMKSGVYLQSYSSIVAYYTHDGSIAYVGRDYNYSATTLRYVRDFFSAIGRKPEGLDVTDLEYMLNRE